MDAVPKQNQLCHVDLPYPPVRVDRQNNVYARAMLDNLGGKESEMSAVSLYFYNALVTAGQPETAAVFHRISIVEMHHMEIFGTLAGQLGQDPRLWTVKQGRRIYWSPGYNQYPIRREELLKNAILGEKLAIRKYEMQAGAIQDPYIVENLRRILLDEQLHVEILTGLLGTAK